MLCAKGASIYDVRRKGGEGVKKCRPRVKVLQTTKRGGRGQKSKTSVAVIYGSHQKGKPHDSMSYSQFPESMLLARVSPEKSRLKAFSRSLWPLKEGREGCAGLVEAMAA